MIRGGKKQLMIIRKLILLVIIATFGTALVYSCGSESDEQLSGNLLQISLSCPDQRETAELSRTFGLERTLGDIVVLKLTVEDGSPPIVPITDEFDPQNPNIMIDVPVGTGRKFTILGLDSEDNIICQGETIADITVDTTEVDIGCDFVFEICTDGIDNDFDELIDCTDPDCGEACMEPGDDDDDVPGDDDDNDNPARENDSAGGCSDEIDNDGDGFIDCVDIDCIRNVECLIQPLPPPPSGGCSMFFDGEVTRPDCNDPGCCAPQFEQYCLCSGICAQNQECLVFENPAFCSNPE